MAVSVLSAAKRLGETSGWNLTNLQFQKMLYIAHMFYLGQKETPLIKEHFEAWNYGPVQPKLYHYLKKFAAGPIPDFAFSNVKDIPETHDCIEYLDEAISNLPRNRLVAITHWENGAWENNYVPDIRGMPITNSCILEEFRKRMAYAERRKAE